MLPFHCALVLQGQCGAVTDLLISQLFSAESKKTAFVMENITICTHVSAFTEADVSAL